MEHGGRKLISCFQGRVSLSQFFYDLFAEIGNRIPKTVGKWFYISHIQIDYVIFVQMLLISGIHFWIHGDHKILE